MTLKKYRKLNFQCSISMFFSSLEHSALDIRHSAVLIFFCLTSVIWGATNYVSFSGSHTPPFTNWITAATNIQSAIDVASNGDTVLVTNGTYSAGGVADYGNTFGYGVFSYGISQISIHQPITVRSVNGPVFTVIEGQGPLGSNAVRCAYVTNGATLTGFTLTNGFTQTVGANDFPGIACLADRIVSNCYAANNSDRFSGGGVLCEPSAVVSNCFIIDNRSGFFGGGVHQGVLEDSSLIGNQSIYGGGASLVIAENCVVYSNTAHSGGGAYNSDVRDSIISGNIATNGGGIDRFAAGLVENCIISDNTAVNAGGGIKSGLAESCTITKNSAPTGGGTYNTTVNNSIVYYNSSNQWSYGLYQNSCTIPEPSGANDGGNNITNPPQFMNWSAGDYRLNSTSLCIDTGSNQTWMVNALDIEGAPRIICVDMGAHEYTLEVNDTPPQANAYQQLQTHTFYVTNDQDWIQFFGTSNHTYKV